MISLLAYTFDYVSELKFRTHLFTFLVIIMVHKCLLIAFETIEIKSNVQNGLELSITYASNATLLLFPVMRRPINNVSCLRY